MSSHTSPPSNHRRKRVKHSADSSSEPSLSDESALAPSTLPEYSTEASDCDSYSGSELSESSEDPSSESSSEDGDGSGSDGEIINVRANRGDKPVMRLGEDNAGTDIRTFLKGFLPQLKAANEELEVQRKAGTLKGCEIDAEGDQNGAQYIEMNLGLGVLEAKEDVTTDSASEVGSDDSEEDETEKDILGKLMGKDRIKRENVGIQEVCNG